MGIIENGVDLEDRIKDLEVRNAVANLRNAATSSLAKYDLTDQVIDDFRTAAGLDTSFSGYATSHTATYIQGADTPDSNTVVLISGDGTGDAAHNVDIDSDNIGNQTGLVYSGSWSIYGSPTFSSTKKYGTLSLNFAGGDGDYIESAANPAGFNIGADPRDWTIEAWVRLEYADPGGIGIFGYGDIGASPGSWASIGWSFYWHGAGGTSAKLQIANGNAYQEAKPTGGVPDDELAADGTWYHLAVISSPTTGTNIASHNRIRIYVDGSMEYEGVEYSNAINTSSTHAFKINGYIYPDYVAPANASSLYMDDIRFSNVARYITSSNWAGDFTPPATSLMSGGGGGMASGNMVAVSTITAADTDIDPPIRGDLVIMYEDATGTADIGNGLTGDIQGYVSRDSGSSWAQGTLVEEGSLGDSKILAFHDVDISSQSSGSSAKNMRYKITTHDQGSSRVTRITGVAFGWH